jgi:membrane protein YqaA with SNARE-associated domain
MTLIDAYIYLFLDSILASLIFVPNIDMAYIVMNVFGYYNKFYMVIIAVVGNCLGACLNYSLGYLLREVKQHIKNYTDSNKLINLATFSSKYLIYLNIFSFVPICGVIFTTASGFLQISFKRTMLLVILGRLGYYCLPIIIA